MKKLTQLAGLDSDDQMFEYIMNNFRNKITTYNWYVNWAKVFDNSKDIILELNILNSLIGEENIEEKLFQIIKQYPNVLKAFPILLATRDSSIEILTDVKKMTSLIFDFRKKQIKDEDINLYISFLMQSGLGKLLKSKKIKNLVDYTIGVEVGLDSNARKNRTGSIMEQLVKCFIVSFCKKYGGKYQEQATQRSMLKEWGINIKMDKSSRRIDFAINYKEKVYLIEVNFYGGGGSKLKSTAGEYCEMYHRYKKQGFEFIWISDGAGWQTTSKPLREYFDIADYLLNLHMLRTGFLEKIILE